MVESVIVAFITGAVVSKVFKSMEKNIARKRTNAQPKSTKLSKDDEELITAILPVINSKD